MKKPLTGLMVFLLLHLAASGAVAAMRIPRDFTLRKVQLGAALYSRTGNGRAEYVQVVDLRLGASVELLRGTVVDAGSGLGPRGGDNPTFRRARLGAFWKRFLASGHRRPFSVSTGALFDETQFPAAPLQLPLVDGGALVTDGFDADAYDGGKAMLAVGDSWAEIAALTAEALAGTAAGKVVAGLAVLADAPPGTRARRTLAGVRDPDGDGTAEVVLLYAGTGVRQADAVATLERFGATAIVALNGGGATQLLARGTTYLASRKSIPQAIAVRAAPTTPGGRYRYQRRIVRVGGCTFNGSDDYTLNGEYSLKRRRTGFSFVPSLESETSVTWSGADRGAVRIDHGVICGGTWEHHSATSRATVEGSTIRIAPYRIVWCEQLNCVFRESLVLDPAGSSGAAAAGLEDDSLGCDGAGCGPAVR